MPLITVYSSLRLAISKDIFCLQTSTASLSMAKVRREFFLFSVLPKNKTVTRIAEVVAVSSIFEHMQEKLEVLQA